MTADSYRRSIESVNRELAQLHKRLADERKKEADKLARAGRVERSINKNTSVSSLNSKAREIERINSDIERSKKRQADLSRQIAAKEEKKHGYESSMMKEQRREQKAFQRSQERQLNDYRAALANELSPSLSPPMAAERTQPVKSHDVFISHASENKDGFVRPLAEALRNRGVNVWYDEFQLAVGDSLRRSIDKGLANSRYGIVVLSSAFFAKNWPQYELDGLVTRETSTSEKVILPIWHKVSKDEVASYSPTLADKVALNTGVQSLSEIVDQLVAVIKPGREPEDKVAIQEDVKVFQVSDSETHAGEDSSVLDGEKEARRPDPSSEESAEA